MDEMINWFLRPFKKLSSEDLYAIMQLRQEVFIVEQSCPYLDADGKDMDALHLMGFRGDHLVAYARLLPPGVSYAEVSIGRVVTAPKYRGKKYGKQLMKKALEEATDLYGAVPIRIGAQTYLKKFYEGFGFIDIGEPY